jgi:hypothetical protein
MCFGACVKLDIYQGKGIGCSVVNNMIFTVFYQILFLVVAGQPIVGQGLATGEVSRSHSDTPHYVGILGK